MKAKRFLIWIVIILLLVGGGFLLYKFFPAKSSGKNSGNSPPDGKLSEQELEKYLLEKRLDLQKFFVFNLGELKTLSQVNTQARNVRVTTQELGNDLTELTNQCFKHLENQGYRMQGVKVDKRRVSFLEDGHDDVFTYDDEWTADLDQKITNGNLYIIFEKEKNYDWPRGWFRADSGKKNLIWTSDFQLRVKNSATIICESKEKALEILKTDPFLEGKI